MKESMSRTRRTLRVVTRAALIAIPVAGLMTTQPRAVNAGGGEEKVTICHVPPGNPANAHEITIGEPALSAHLNNHPGDHVGTCFQPPPA